MLDPPVLIKLHGSRYLDDGDATNCAFDKEGYFRTGDIFRREGEEYVFEGRKSFDCKRLTISVAR